MAYSDSSLESGRIGLIVVLVVWIIALILFFVGVYYVYNDVEYAEDETLKSYVTWTVILIVISIILGFFMAEVAVCVIQFFVFAVIAVLLALVWYNVFDSQNTAIYYMLPLMFIYGILAIVLVVAGILSLADRERTGAYWLRLFGGPSSIGNTPGVGMKSGELSITEL